MIEIKNISKSYGDIKVLDKLNCTIQDGLIYGLVGANGAGKSTLLRIINGIYLADSGEVLIDGENPLNNPKVKQNIVFVPDDLFFYSGYTIHDMALFYKALYENFDMEYLEKLAKTLKLDTRRKISTFSKGMKRQAFIIFALAISPQLLLLDEAFDGLDPLDRINKISMLYTMDRTIWFANQYDSSRPLICDRYTTSNILHMSTLIIHNGGTIDDVYHYINNIECLEYGQLNIPEPNLVIYLDASTDQLSKNLKTTRQVLDIHEDESIFKDIDSVKNEIIDYCGWKVVNCCDEQGMKSIENIHNDIVRIIEEYYENKK